MALQMRSSASVRGRWSRNTVHTVRAQAARPAPFVQLGTAKLPAKIDPVAFSGVMFTFASTLTQNGRNYPFVLPLDVTKASPTEWSIRLLKRLDGQFDAAGEIVGTVEQMEQDQVLFLRFYEGPAAFAGRQTPPPTDPKARLDIALQSLVDVDTIMNTFPDAIRNAVRITMG